MDTTPSEIPTPLKDEFGGVIEPVDAYIARARSALPDMPEDVIDQWLYSHPQVIDDWDWLNLASLHFTLEEWVTSDVPALEREKGAVHTYRCNLNRLGPCERSNRMSRLIEYFAAYHTWPRYPIMLENLEGEHVRPDRWRCREPHQLLEGHHRFAVFSLFRDQDILCDKHHIWVARKSTS